MIQPDTQLETTAKSPILPPDRNPAKVLLEEESPLLSSFATAAQERFDGLGEKGVFLKTALAATACPVKSLLEFLYATMPTSDILNYPFETYLDYAEHGQFLLQNHPKVAALPAEIFLFYVLAHRIYDETLTPCRSFFYREISKSTTLPEAVQEAVLAINDWCAGEVTYQTTDERTLSPKAVFQTGFGRCGEESAFVVSALRSMGIPARQIYAPRWSHCDDNHAWVEVWHQGEWYFIGACESELYLNRGWFIPAASRGMLVHSRLFSGTLPEEMLLPILEGEIVLNRDEEVTYLNQLPRYAKTCHVEIELLLPDHSPAAEAEVVFHVLNYANFYPLTTLICDSKGRFSLITNKGTLLLQVNWKGQPCEILFDVTTSESRQIQLKETPVEKGWFDFDMISPPESREMPFTSKEDKAKLLTQKQRLAARQKKKCSTLSLAKEDDRQKEALLAVLTPKDLCDVCDEVLEEHWLFSSAYRSQFPADIWAEYLLNPRVDKEPLTTYRAYIQNYYSTEEKMYFSKEPQRLWQSLNETITLNNAGFITTPQALLSGKIGNLLSLKILFVAIARSIGLPARLDSASRRVEYYQQNQFVPLDEDDKFTGTLRLYSHSSKGDQKIQSMDTNWIYGQNWSLSRLTKGSYQLYDLSKSRPFSTEQCFSVMPGNYRLITANRLPKGDILGRCCYFNLAKNTTVEQELTLRLGRREDILRQIKLPDFSLYQIHEQQNLSLTRLLGQGKRLLLWLSPKEEPTEHILNELLERAADFSYWQEQTSLILPQDSSSDDKVKRLLDIFPKIEVFNQVEGDTEQVLARKMYQEPDLFPFILLLNRKGEGLYASAGYNVGVAEMILQLLPYA